MRKHTVWWCYYCSHLKEFVEPTTPWVHSFDVMAWNLRTPGRPTGGEALGIRAVFNYLQNRFNK
ncbi:hypothetical protein P4S63_22180 [Pseudoalteromonas sp. B193]